MKGLDTEKTKCKQHRIQYKRFVISIGQNTRSQWDTKQGLQNLLKRKLALWWAENDGKHGEISVKNLPKERILVDTAEQPGNNHPDWSF